SFKIFKFKYSLHSSAIVLSFHCLLCLISHKFVTSTTQKCEKTCSISIQTHTHTYTHTHTHIHTYIYIYICTERQTDTGIYCVCTIIANINDNLYGVHFASVRGANFCRQMQ
ncbi:hypothetical protein LOAG_00394, partial [Loa loa]